MASPAQSVAEIEASVPPPGTVRGWSFAALRCLIREELTCAREARKVRLSGHQIVISACAEIAAVNRALMYRRLRRENRMLVQHQPEGFTSRSGGNGSSYVAPRDRWDP